MSIRLSPAGLIISRLTGGSQTVARNRKPRIITPGAYSVKNQLGTVRQTNTIVTRFDDDVNVYLMSGRAEGGRVELQWLMSHSLV
jgi:hypothetical protein